MEWKVLGKKTIEENKGVGGETLMLTAGNISVPCGEGFSGQEMVMDGVGGSNSREGLKEGEMKDGLDKGKLVVGDKMECEEIENGEVGKRNNVAFGTTDVGLNVNTVQEMCGLEQSISDVPSGVGSGKKEGFVSIEVRETPSAVFDEGEQGTSNNILATGLEVGTSNRFEILSDGDEGYDLDVQNNYCSDSGSILVQNGDDTGVGKESVIRQSQRAKALPQKLNL
ncbi:hypothetical protein I3843_05G019800 [Carya illinoinensis]|nr:hypothetical protein I3843_05G019800 [Carya illinoinensis]